MGRKLVKIMIGAIFYISSVYSVPVPVLSYLALESDVLALTFVSITNQLCDLKPTS